jgi:Tfp pilus assembly protein PilF
MPRARAAALKALDLDEASAEAHTSLAFVSFLYDWDFTSAERHFRSALELNPQYANAHHWYSHYLMAHWRSEESLAEARRALELDPLNFITSTHLGWHYLYAREPDRALETLRRALEMDPSPPSAALVHRFLGFAYQQKGQMKEAVAEMEKALQLREGSAELLGELGYAYAVSGMPERARGILQDLEARSKGRYTSPYFSALVYAGLGDRDQALARLDRAVSDRSDAVVYLQVEPRLDALRSDPRFTALVRRVGLAP